MKKTVAVTIAVFLTWAAGAFSAVDWEHNYDAGLERAKKDKKLVMVDMYTDWCGWCKKLDRDVYADAKVSEKLARNFVAVKINPEKGSPMFSVGDIRDVPSLAGKLKQAKDRLSQLLSSQFSAATRQTLSAYQDAGSDPRPIADALVQELNKVIKGDSGYDEKRFAGVTLSAETRRLLDQQPRGDALVSLNRLLLEDAYPLEIVKTAEKTKKNQELAWAFGTHGYPHIVFLDDEGHKLSEIGGYLPAGDFLKRLNDVAEKAQKK